MRFYRVCHATRRNVSVPDLYAGPYNGHLVDDDRLAAMGWSHCDPAHPPFHVDVFPGGSGSGVCDVVVYGEGDHECGPDVCGVHNASEYACGFTSEQGYRDWFAGYRRLLRALGFVLRVYDVPDGDVVQGTRQAAARIDALARAEDAGRVRTLVCGSA